MDIDRGQDFIRATIEHREFKEVSVIAREHPGLYQLGLHRVVKEGY